MNIEFTSAILGLAIFILAFSYLKSRRPKDIDSPWSVPWNGIMFIAILMSMLMVNHLLTLIKVHPL